jgi:hypothetical protein
MDIDISFRRFRCDNAEACILGVWRNAALLGLIA